MYVDGLLDLDLRLNVNSFLRARNACAYTFIPFLTYSTFLIARFHIFIKRNHDGADYYN